MSNNKISSSFYALLSMPATAMGFALCVQISALSWILNTQYGFDIHEVGLVWLAGPLAGILGQVIVGVISDNVWFWNGRRRPFIIIGGTIAALMILALPYIDVINDTLGVDSMIGVAITVALTLDLAINVSFNPARSIIADVTPEGEARTKGYTWMQTISGFFGVLAYFIGAYLGNYTLIYAGAIFVFIAGVFPILFIKEPRHLNSSSSSTTIETDESVLDEVIVEHSTHHERTTDWTEFFKICLAHAFTWVGVQTMFVYIFAYIREVIMNFEGTGDLTQEQSGEIGFTIAMAFLILNTVGFILPSTVLEPISKRIGRVRTHTLAIGVMAIGYGLLVMFGNSVTSLFIIMGIVGIGWSAVVSLPFAIMSEVVNQSRMGLMMGLFNLSVVIPQIVASLLGGFIQSQADKNVIFMISAITLAISAVTWLIVKEQESSKSLEVSGGH